LKWPTGRTVIDEDVEAFVLYDPLPEVVVVITQS